MLIAFTTKLKKRTWNHTFSQSSIIWEPAIETWAQEMNGRAGNELGARRAEQFPHLGNYTLTPCHNVQLSTHTWQSTVLCGGQNFEPRLWNSILNSILGGHVCRPWRTVIFPIRLGDLRLCRFDIIWANSACIGILTTVGPQRRPATLCNWPWNRNNLIIAIIL